MQKQAPSAGRIMVAIGFSLSCFGILLFLWITFGGPIPLKPKSYQMTVDIPEATNLAIQSDVRIGGVSVGKVKGLELSPDSDAARATIEIETEFAPISSDTRAIIRLKTLLGETYVELTPGTNGGERTPVALGSAVDLAEGVAARVEPLPEDGHLPDSQVREAVQIDEIFNALDAETRTTFQRWQQNAAKAIRNRGSDFNDTLGNLGPFLTDAARIVEALRRQDPHVEGLIRDTGAVFEALTERDRELAAAITGSNAAFGAFADSDRALAESIRILPTFERETRLTLQRLDSFRENAHPLVRDLLPVAGDVSPTFRSVRRLSPHLKRLFPDLDGLFDAGDQGLPALQRLVNELGPVLGALDPVLANLNPVLRFVGPYKHSVTDFIAAPPTGVSTTLTEIPGQPAPRHTLRQLAYISPQSLTMFDTRLDANRGNGYVPPLAIGSFEAVSKGAILPDFDCKNTDYTFTSQDPDEDEVTTMPPAGPGFAPCVFFPDPFAKLGFEGRFPNVVRDP